MEELRPSLRDIQCFDDYRYADGCHAAIDHVFQIVENFKKSSKSVPEYEEAEGQIEEVEDNG